MAFSKQLMIVVIFLIHTNEAINLNFFSFNKGVPSNETSKEKISIEPTKTVSTSIITDNPIAIVNYSLPELDVHVVDNEKHEFENETEAVDASPENTSDVKPSVPNLSGQEIDETRNPSYSVNETIDEGSPQKESTNETSISNQSDTAKISIPKVYGLPERKTVTFTHTIVSKFTKYETVYPSCVKFEKVKSICNGVLITIQPTPTLLNVVNEKTKTLNGSNAEFFDDNFDIIEPPEIRKKRSSNGTTTLENLKKFEKNGPNTFLLEPSELDYEFEEFDPVLSNKNHSEKFQGRGTQPISEIQSVLLEPKFEFVTEYISRTSVQTITNYDATATLIAHNCIPRSINLKRCFTKPDYETRYPILPVPVTPIIREQNVDKSKTETYVKKNEQKIFVPKPSPSLPHPEKESQKPLDSIYELNNYLVMNADRLIHNGGGYETIDLNAGSTIIETSDKQSPILHKRKSIRVKRER